MYKSYEFTFAGVSSAMYGLYIADIGSKKHSDHSFGNQANIVETRIANRVTPLHYGVRYHDEPLKFTLIFGSESYMNRYELQEIANWLTGYQEYQWLSIIQPDMEHVQFRCLIQELTPISVGWFPVAFEAQVICDCPYAYGYPFERQYRASGKRKVLFRNEGSVREYIKPMLTYIPASDGDLRIINHSDNDREFAINQLMSGTHVTVDNENGIIQEENYGYNLYDRFNLNFFRLVPGDNDLTLIGDGLLTISGRFLYNVGG